MTERPYIRLIDKLNLTDIRPMRDGLEGDGLENGREYSVLPATARSQPRKQRNPQQRQRVSIQATETIRNRLQMNKENFSEALGLHPTTYAGYVQKGFCAKTVALAAEALMRPASPSGEPMDEVFILRIVNGVPTAARIGELRRLTLDEVEYYLVPVGSTKT